MLAFRKLYWAPGRLQPLSHALATGAPPLLRCLDLGESGEFSDSDVEALAGMLEARAQRSVRCNLKYRPSSSYNCSEALRRRLMMFLLPAVTELEFGEWETVHDTCFVAARPPQLKKLTVVNATITPPVEVLEAMPALKELSYEANRYEDYDEVMDIEPSRRLF